MNNIDKQFINYNSQFFADIFTNKDISEKDILENKNILEIINIFVQNKQENIFITSVLNNVDIVYQQKYEKNRFFLMSKEDVYLNIYKKIFYVFSEIKELNLTKNSFEENLFLFNTPEPERQKFLYYYINNTEAILAFLNFYFKYFNENDKDKNTKNFLFLISKFKCESTDIFKYSLMFDFLDKINFENEEIKLFFNINNRLANESLSIKNLDRFKYIESFKENENMNEFINSIINIDKLNYNNNFINYYLDLLHKNIDNHNNYSFSGFKTYDKHTYKNSFITNDFKKTETQSKNFLTFIKQIENLNIEKSKLLNIRKEYNVYLSSELCTYLHDKNTNIFLKDKNIDFIFSILFDIDNYCKQISGDYLNLSNPNPNNKNYKNLLNEEILQKYNAYKEKTLLNKEIISNTNNFKQNIIKI